MADDAFASRMPLGAAGRTGVLILGALAWGICRAADLGPCDDVSTDLVGPYTVACAGKSECVPSDQLEIKPVDPGAKPLSSACLRFVGGPKPPAESLPLHSAAPGRPPEANAWPLSPLIERWIRDPGVEAAFRAAPRARQPVDVILVDAAAQRFKVQVMFDLAALWVNGALPLQLTNVDCSPCKIGGLLKITAANLATWKIATNSDPAALSLVMADNRIPGIAPMVSTADGTLTFPLRRVADNPDNAAAWANVLDRVLNGSRTFKVGLADAKGGVATAEKQVQFEVSDSRILIVLGAGVLLAIVLWLVGRKAKWVFLRDSYSIPDNIGRRETMPFSLGRSQMLFWTLVVIATWVCVGWSSGDWLSVNESSLALMGIGIGTAVGGAASVPSGVTQLVGAYTDAKTAVQATPGTDAEGRLLAATEALTSEITSRAWYADVISDYGEDVGLHRVQSVLFTGLFGLYFSVQAFIHGTMPVLSASHLALLGISGSTYVGFKYVGKG